MSSNIPPIPPKPSQPSPGPDDSQGPSIWERVKEIVSSVFEDSKKESLPTPALAVKVDPALQALDPNDPLWPAIRLVQKDGLQLATLSEELRNNPIVVKEAVKNNGLALKFASTSLQRDPPIALEAINNNHQAMKDVPRDISSLYRAKDQLLVFIQALGYKNDLEGLCYGFAMMAVQAILCDDFDTFAFRLDKIAILINKYKQMVSEADFQELVKKDASALKKDSDLVAFLDGVALYQEANKYPDLFENSKPRTQMKWAEITEPLLRPSQLELRGGSNSVERFVRIYTVDELALHLKKLKNLFQKDLSCAITLAGGDHILTIAYDLKESSWVIINDAVIIKWPNEVEDLLAEHIHDRLTPDKDSDEDLDAKTNLCAITTTLFTTKDQSPSLRNILERDCPDLLDIPKLSEEKCAFARDSFFFANIIRNEDFPMLKAALEQGIIFSASDRLGEKITSQYWDTIAKTYLKDRNPAFASLIIDTMGIAFVDKKDRREDTFLLAAVQNNDIPIVKLLLAAGANLNQTNSDGKTPLDIALDNNFLELAKLLAARPKL